MTQIPDAFWTINMLLLPMVTLHRAADSLFRCLEIPSSCFRKHHGSRHSLEDFVLIFTMFHFLLRLLISQRRSNGLDRTRSRSNTLYQEPKLLHGRSSHIRLHSRHFHTFFSNILAFCKTIGQKLMNLYLR